MNSRLLGMVACGLAASAILSIPALAAENAGDSNATGTIRGTLLLKKGKLQENSIVYIEGVASDIPAPTNTVVLDQKKDTFLPHLLPLQLGQSVAIKNSDPHVHNVHPYIKGKSLFNNAQMPGNTRDWRPKELGKHLILCDMHDEMSAFVVTFDHPYFRSVTHEEHGKACEFTFTGVPEGRYQLVWMRDIKGKLRTKKTDVTVVRGQTATVEL